jgi:hypothetical protein
MEFFNKKEDVIEIKLTPFGIHKLSQGNFSPEYYSFFDDDILYDSSYANSGSAEEKQNNIEERIRTNTPSLRPFRMNSGISSSQTPIDQTLRDVIADFDLLYGTTPLYAVPSSLYNSASIAYASDNFLKRPIGTSKLMSPYLPAWSTGMLQGEITSSSAIYTGSLNTVGLTSSIPQLNIVYKCSYYVSQIEGYVAADPSDIETDYYFTQPTDAHNLQAITTDIFPDGTYITVDRRDIVLSTMENNADFFKKNFDIEVFVSNDHASGSEPTWRQLFFNNNLDINAEPTQDDVEYYLTLNVDREINTSLIDQLNIQNNATFRSSRDNSISTREYFIRDLYNPEEEICE